MSRMILTLLILASFSLPIKTFAADNEPNLDELIEQVVPPEVGTCPTPAPETIPAPIAEPTLIPDLSPTQTPEDAPASE